MFKQRAVYSVVAAVLIVAGACGSDSESDTTTSEVPGIVESEGLPPDDDQEGPPTGQDRSAELLGRWDVASYLLPDGGSFTNVVGEVPVFIEFGADGTISYHTGCNPGGTEFTTSGSYFLPESALDDTPEGQAINIGPVFEQAEDGCDGFLGDQDRDLPANMGAATRFALDGDRLLLLDEIRLIEATRSG